MFLWSSYKDLRGCTKQNSNFELFTSLLGCFTVFRFSQNLRGSCTWHFQNNAPVLRTQTYFFELASIIPTDLNASFREVCDLPIRSFVRHLASRPYCQVLQHGPFGAFSMAGGLRCCLNQRNEIIWNPCIFLMHLRFSRHRFNWDFSNTCAKIKIRNPKRHRQHLIQVHESSRKSARSWYYVFIRYVSWHFVSSLFYLQSTSFWYPCQTNHSICNDADSFKNMHAHTHTP